MATLTITGTTAAASTDLVTRADVKQYLSVTGTGDDDLFDDLIDKVTAAIEAVTDRIFSNQTYTEIHDGAGQRNLLVLHPPVNSITSIHDDPNRDFEAASLVAATDYTFFGDDGIIRLDVPLSRGQGSVRVVYSGGYATVPHGVQLAAYEIIGAAYNLRESAGMTTEKIGKYAATYERWPEHVKKLLGPYTIAVMA